MLPTRRLVASLGSPLLSRVVPSPSLSLLSTPPPLPVVWNRSSFSSTSLLTPSLRPLLSSPLELSQRNRFFTADRAFCKHLLDTESPPRVWSSGQLTKEAILHEIPSTPTISPSYPHGPYHFKNREYVIIAYETDPAAIKRVVPHPLIPNKDNIVLYEWIKMPDSSGFGDYVESGTVIPCILPDGRSVNYTAQMFLDCEPPIACGREIWGFPKKYAHPSVEVNHDTVCCSLSYSGQEVAVGTMAYKHKPIPLHVIQASFSNLFCNLKIIPRANMSGPQIAQLVGYRLQDVEVLEAWEGPARLHLTSSVNAPTGDLPALRVIGGKHIKANLTLPYGEVLYDYVLEAAKKRDAGVSPPVNRDDDELTEEKVLKLPSMPAIRPSYSLIPPHLNNREMFVVIYESDREAILRCLPDTLEADDTNHVVIQFSHTEGTGLGSYSKCSVHIPCRVRRDRVNGVVEGQNMYLYNVMNIMDCSSVITLGREIFGQPNKFGHSKLAVNKDTLVASVDYGHREVVTASMAYKYAPMDKSKAFALLEAPELNLKLIPDADGKKGIAKLMAFHFSDAEVFSAYSGPVRLHFVPHVNAPFADLPVRGVCEGAHLKVDMQMTRSVTVHNYLKDID